MGDGIEKSIKLLGEPSSLDVQIETLQNTVEWVREVIKEKDKEIERLKKIFKTLGAKNV